MSSAVATGPTYVTAEEFEAMEDASGFELDDGVLVERNVSVISSMVGSSLAGEIHTFVDAHGLGIVLGTDIGLQICPGRPQRIPRPDVAFVAKERLTREVLEASFLQIPPNLIVEVVSPGDAADDVDRKVNEYLSAGVRLIWVVHPASERAYVYRLDGTGEIIPRDGALDGEDILPGFRLPLQQIFERVFGLVRDLNRGQ